MSREILFKGKRTDNCEWVEGYFGIKDGYSNEKIYCIMKPTFDMRMEYSYFTDYEVIPETVCECSFVPDKNGVMMYEGDIVTGLFLFGMSINAVVAFKDGSFGLEWCRGGANTFTAFTSICNVEYEVIGNVHDNPELLN